MLALRAVRQTGRGQVVDVSMQECCLSLAPETGVALFLDDGLRRTRPGNRRAVTRPWGLYPCADGFVSFLVLQPAHWRAMAEWIAEATGIDGVLDDVFVDLHVRWEVSDFIDDCTELLTRPRTKLDLFVEGQRRGIPITPVNTIADLRSDPHLQQHRVLARRRAPAAGHGPDPGCPVPRRPRLVALDDRADTRPAHRRRARAGLIVGAVGSATGYASATAASSAVRSSAGQETVAVNSAAPRTTPTATGMFEYALVTWIWEKLRSSS